MGILSNIKHLGPLFLYATGVLFFLRGATGDGRWALALATFLIPLRNVTDKIQEFPLGNQFTDLLIIGALMGWFISCSKQNKPLLTSSYLNFIVFILFIYMAISLYVGNLYLNRTFIFDDRVKDCKNFCLMPLLFFITLNHITDRLWVVRMLIVMTLAIILIDYYTANQIHYSSSLESREKITGTFQFLGPNEVAAFFNQYTIIMMSIILFIKNKRLKWILLAIICANIYCILFLYSRGAYLGLLGGMFFLFLIKSRKLLVPLILLLLLWQTILPANIIERIKQTENSYGQLDESSEGRLIIWHQSLDLFAKSPILGIGYGVFRNLGFSLGDTHNIYIKILVEQGVIGMLIFLIIIFCFLRMGYVLYKKGEDDFNKGMGLGMMACIIVMMINSCFGDRWSYFELSTYLWVFAGLVARLIVLSQDQGPLPEIQQKTNTIVPTTFVSKQKKKIRYYDL